MNQYKMQSVSKVLIFIALFVILFAFSYVLSSLPTHDHNSYIKHWNAVIEGENPYSIDSNAYGPIHNVLSLLYAIHFNLPRLFFVFLWLMCSFSLSIIINKNSYLPDTHKYALYFILLLNPYFWVFVVKYGTNDILMAFFVLFSLILFHKKKDFLSAFFMAIAIAVKFVPVVMLPFLIFSRLRIRWRFILSLGLTLVFIFGVSYWFWGNEIFHPLQMGHERRSKILSIFRFLRGEFSPLRLFVNKPNLDWASTYIILAAISTFFLLHIKYKLEGILPSIIAVGLLLTLYKVSHPQFYITLVMLIVLWVSLDYKKNIDTGDVLLSIFTFIIWISFVSFLYDLTNGYDDTGWREIIGLPTFLISGWMLINLIKYSFNIAGNYGITNHSNKYLHHQ